MLKLARLPDRTPVRITVTVSPDLNQALRDYAALYRATYGQAESIADLIPFMLEAFLEGDRAFGKARKASLPAAETEEPPRPKRKPRPASKATGQAAAPPPASRSTPIPEA